MPFVEMTDGAQIHYEAYGSGAPLVLLPGIGCDSRIWGPFPKALGHYFHTVVYDPRGLGRSTGPPGTDLKKTGIDRMARDVADLIRGLSLGQAHVLGSSLGGVVAQVLASGYPEVVRRLVLVSTSGRLERWSSRVLDIFEILARRLPPDEYAKVVTSLVVSPDYFRLEPKRVEDLEKKFAFPVDATDIFHAQIRALRELSSKAPTVEKPTLILAGTKDWLTPPFCSEEIHSRIEGSRLIMLDGGHSCLMERSDEGLVAILGFLRDSDGTREENP
jgi:pimeloyl-ACP methyl ester carboxylesterase